MSYNFHQDLQSHAGQSLTLWLEHGLKFTGRLLLQETPDYGVQSYAVDTPHGRVRISPFVKILAFEATR